MLLSPFLIVLCEVKYILKIVLAVQIELKYFVETLNAFMAEGYYTSMINMRSFCVFHTLMQLAKETYFG